MSGPRQFSLDASRLDRWLANFARDHGPADIVAREGEGLLVRAATAQALIWPTRGGFDGESLAGLVDHAQSPDPTGVIIVRAGGYACALVADGKVRASKVGSRYVQGRTAAGGWSQQRYARRRQNQRDQLVEAAAEVAGRIISEPVELLVTGGDRALAEKAAALAEAGLRGVAQRGPHLTLPDPSAKLVAQLPGMLASISIRVSEMPEGPPGSA